MIPADVSRYLEDEAVLGVFLGGSRGSGGGDAQSDWDIYVITDSQVSDQLRDEVADAHNPSHVDRAPGHFDDGDCWVEGGAQVDVMFWDYTWLVGALENVIVHHRASEGYTTAHWATVASWQCVGMTPRGTERLEHLARLVQSPIDDELVENIVAHNYSLMRPVLFSLEAQIAKAVDRTDVVSVQHRISALLASWFDIVFAVNKVLHPGEKKLLGHLRGLDRPDEAEADIRGLCAGETDRVGPFIDRLEAWLQGLRK